ncbi:MAG TPA: hypothetical protein VMX74_12830, partial [Pirellulales bacterium]|nr:hypothetical protein [Pirellulales bacterium]
MIAEQDGAIRRETGTKFEVSNNLDRFPAQCRHDAKVFVPELLAVFGTEALLGLAIHQQKAWLAKPPDLAADFFIGKNGVIWLGTHHNDP